METTDTSSSLDKRLVKRGLLYWTQYRNLSPVRFIQFLIPGAAVSQLIGI